MAGLRNNSDIVKGNRLMVFYGAQGAPIAFSTASNLSVTTNTTEVTTKDHGDYPGVVANTLSWEITTENLYTNDAAALLTAQTTKQPVTVTFAPASNNTNGKGVVGDEGSSSEWTAGTAILTGQALITSCSINAPAGDNATFSATFTGVGAYTLGGEE